MVDNNLFHRLKDKLIALPPEKWEYRKENWQPYPKSFSTNIENFLIELETRSERVGNETTAAYVRYEDVYSIEVYDGKKLIMRVKSDELYDVRILYQNIRDKVEPYLTAKKIEAWREKEKQAENSLKNLEGLL